LSLGRKSGERLNLSPGEDDGDGVGGGSVPQLKLLGRLKVGGVLGELPGAGSCAACFLTPEWGALRVGPWCVP